MAEVLITGAGGFLGTTMTRVFLEAGHQVRAGDLPGADLSHHQALGAKPVVCDVTKPESLLGVMEGVDVVVHAAGLFRLGLPAETLWAVNASGARFTAEAAAACGVKRFVMISSTSVYGRCGKHVAEDAPKRPAHPYDKSKWAGEEEAVAISSEKGVPWVVLRPTLIYGPGGRYGIAQALAFFALRVHHGRRRLPFSNGGPMGHHVHVNDVARAAEWVSHADGVTGGVFNVADDGPMCAGELIRRLVVPLGVKVMRGLPWAITPIFGWMKPLMRWYLSRLNPKVQGLWKRIVGELDLVPGLDPAIDVDWLDYIFHDHSYDNQRLKDLGFTYAHPDVREGLVETLDWYRETRWLP